MKKYDVGYGRPPAESRFQVGNDAWKRRKKRQPLGMTEVVESFLDTPQQYREGGRIKAATRRELRVKKIVNDAVKGDVKSADMILKLLEHEQKNGGRSNQIIRINNWLPDRPAQTADEKTTESNIEGEAATPEWWIPVANDPPEDGGDQK